MPERPHSTGSNILWSSDFNLEKFKINLQNRKLLHTFALWLKKIVNN